MMSPEQASIVVPLGTILIVSAIIYANIRVAKNKVSEWKRLSAVFFIRSIATVRIEHTASLWMRKFGYDEADGLILAKQQLMASIEILLGVIFFFVIASKLQGH